MPYCWLSLSDTPIAASADALTTELDKIFPGHFLPRRDEGSFVIKGVSPIEFMIISKVPGYAGAFLLHSRYEDDGERNNAPPYQHALSIASIGGDDEPALRFIGRVLAHLSPPEAAFLINIETGEVIRFDDEVRARMRHESPFEGSP